MSARRVALGVLLGALLAGCAAPQIRYVPQPLPLPARPVLPPVAAHELTCLSDDAYRRLVERERLRREYAERLEAIIRATQPDG